ncbi:hypothetical protein M8C21_030524, partial [Ambrosia artemisiifolia]
MQCQCLCSSSRLCLILLFQKCSSFLC